LGNEEEDNEFGDDVLSGEGEDCYLINANHGRIATDCQTILIMDAPFLKQLWEQQ